ncbi:Hypothetical predicted protein [Cloeon dipterum]|uniref:Peptidase S1 domain-containing protein n=1 Tax=Cloeon dipterum TaxID=197152 RepID=A0A8S1DFI0_9INSE|nr:Hypothetical predicted protein [Cloeon dipterum]
MLEFVFLTLLAGSASAAVAARHPVETFEARIIGGNAASLGEYPSQLSLQYQARHTCGASIISEKYALTATHCVIDRLAEELTMRSGSLDIYGGDLHQVINYTTHANYSAFYSSNNDIAIIEVFPEFVYSANVQPITLPKLGDEPAVGSPATVIGWGRIGVGEPLSDFLKEAVIEIRNQTLCEQIYNDIGYDVYPGQICADIPEGNLGSCNGDSGGPLFVDGVVHGLVSWAYGCARPGYPTIYNRVAYYRDWIFEHSGV